MFSFFKPKWQHRNPKVRIEAIQQGNVGTELLFNLAQNDNDMNVRMEAFSKINSIKELYTLLLHEPSDQGKSAVLEQMLAIFKQSDHPKDAIQQFMGSTVRRDFPMAKLLLLTDDKTLKLIILSFLTRTNELQNLLDAGYVFAFEEIEAIKERHLLIYLAKNYQAQDKKVVSFLKEIIHQLEEDEKRLAAKDLLLEKYQALIASEQLPALNHFSELENEWNAYQLGDDNQKYRDEYLLRYHTFNQRRQQKIAEFNGIEEKHKNKMLDNYQLAGLFVTLEALSQEETFSLKEKADVQSLIKQLNTLQQDNKKDVQSSKVANRVIKGVRALLNRPYRLSDAELEKAKDEIVHLPTSFKERAELLSQLNQRAGTQAATNVFDEIVFHRQLEKLDALIQNGELQMAMGLQQELFAALKETTSQEAFNQNSRALRQVTGSLQDQMDAVRWGVFTGLEMLCEKAEALSHGNYTSEYIGIMLKQLRDEWKESQKGIDRAPHRLYQRFENACRKAHQKVVVTRNEDNNARAVYKKEAEELLATLSQYMDGIDWLAPKWDELLEMRQRFLQEWNRYLNQYSTDGVLSYGAPLFLNKDKNYFERSMRKILKPLEAALQKERTKEKLRRQEIVAHLKVLVDAGSIKEAVEQSRLANRSFVPTVRLSRHEENVLWKELRLINDQVFALREEVLSVEEGERAQNAEKKYALLKKLEALFTSLHHESVINDIYQQLDVVGSEWLEIGVVPKRDYHKLEIDFKEISNKIREQLRVIAEEKAQQARLNLVDLSKKIGALEKKAVEGGAFVMDDELLEISDTILKKRIKCLEQIIAGQSSARQFLVQKNMCAADKAKELVLLQEILLDKPIIEAEREERLALQVKILENSMNNSGNEKDRSRSLKRLDNEWLENCVGEIADELYQRFR